MMQRQSAPVTAPRFTTAPAKIEARGVEKSFRLGDETLSVLSGVSVHAGSGELIAIVGPSGCGKSTFLNILAGLLPPERGQVWIDGQEVTGKLGLAGYMPQRDSLLPWKTVLDNTTLGLEILGVPRKRARQEALSWFDRFGLMGFERAYPSALSGGMRQRAALLRTFLSRRDILLLDEPLGALDAITRMDMQEWLLGVWGAFERTIVLVTHDVDEAIYLSDRLYVMTARPGRIGAVVDVDIPRPRPYKDVVTSLHFTDLKRRVLAALAEGIDASRH